MVHARLHRREFLTRSSLIALAPSVPAFLTRAARAAENPYDGRILVVIQLSGGNDGVNTVVPYTDEGYAKHRDTLRLPTEQLIKVNDRTGLHPALRPAADLLEDGRLAIVQGVGYPNPNRSHDVSMAIWQTARMDRSEHKTFGWLGRAMDQRDVPADGAPQAVLLGDDSPPVALRGRRSTSVALANLQDLKLASRPTVPDYRLTSAPGQDQGDLAAFARRATLDAYAAADLIDEVTRNATSDHSKYPATQLADRLKSVAQLIKANFGTPVYYAIQPGYDTHAVQLPTHARLLQEIGGALKAFLDDLRTARLDDRVLVLCFSEFGRRVQEDASLGTDHGTAGPVFLAGPCVIAGMVGLTPSLIDLEDGDLKAAIDFRQVYATILHQWLGITSPSVLTNSFELLPIINA
jgi:uncharacterized protein (DUF1501 family)